MSQLPAELSGKKKKKKLLANKLAAVKIPERP